MFSILEATENDYLLLAGIGRASFIESHGHSASAAEIGRYINETYTAGVLKKELRDPENIYHIIYHQNQAAGYSKIVLNTVHPDIVIPNVTKCERLYLLKEFYHLKLGTELFTFNIDLSKRKGQAGMWLYVWKENPGAIAFYKKAGFIIIGSHNFKLTETHSNPNHHMFLKY